MPKFFESEKNQQKNALNYRFFGRYFKMTQKNYILKFRKKKKIEKIPIFRQNDFSKYHIWRANMHAAKQH